MTQQPAQAPLVAKALDELLGLAWRNPPAAAQKKREIVEEFDSLARQLEQVQKALKDELDNWNPEARPTITAERDEALRQLEQAEREKERAVAALRMMRDMADGFSADFAGTDAGIKFAIVASNLELTLSEQHERSSDLGNSVARKNTKPSGEVGEEA